MSLFSRLTERLFGAAVQRRVDLAVRALDDVRDRLYAGRSIDTYPRDRRDYDREEVLADALDAWRVNPLARRVVGLTSQYVVGGGMGIESKHARTHKFLNDWWNHRLNRMTTRVFEWCDELSRSGELFIALSTDASGMSYVRAVPAADIQEIETAVNDLEQELFIYEKPDLLGEAKGYNSSSPATPGLAPTMLRGRAWPVYHPDQDPRGEDDTLPPVMLHYAVNKPVGAKHGESDLAPMLRWLARYASWLEDRARLNRFRNTFVYWVKAKFASQAERLARQSELNANPPNPGSILVTDESETWSVLYPNLASFEAAEDGLALKKMVAVGSGNPMHFLAEPEGATRTTAESAGGPTFRHYQQRQVYFIWLLEDLARAVIRRRRAVDRLVNPDSEIKVTGTDISARDNAALATAASMVVAAFASLRDRGLIDDAELLRIIYRFSGEVVDIEDMLKRGEKAPPPKIPAAPGAAGNVAPINRPPGAGGQTPQVKVDPISGEPKGIDG